MLLPLISCISAQRRITTAPVVAENKTVISLFSAQQKVAREIIGGDNSMCEAISLSASPHVLPGVTPTTIKDMDVTIGHIY